jgi:hypothetical protein
MIRSLRYRITCVLATVVTTMLAAPCTAQTAARQATVARSTLTEPEPARPKPPEPVAAAQPKTPQPAATTQQSPSPATCKDVAGFHDLDFWIGDWDVYVDGKMDGRDTVSRILSGCAVTEDWTGVDGSRGMSLFYYNSFVDRWTQVWLTELATRRGGLKEKTLVARSAGSVRFQGLLPGAAGSRLVLDRTTLSAQPNGRIHQIIENSLDGGTTWRAAYDAIYVPHGSQPPLSS